MGSVPSVVEVKFSPCSACHSCWSQASRPPTAIELSMIVEMTSLTPRVVLRMPASPAYSAPTTIATTMMTRMWRTCGRLMRPPICAANKKATRYWPSTPMLNRFMRNPIAAATADR